MELFFISEIHLQEPFSLPEEESKHLYKVLRHVAGDHIRITDGSGKYYTAVIDSISQKQCTIHILREENTGISRSYHLHVAIAPTKNNERFEWFLEKGTEIGMDEITPLICRHSERRELKTERMNKILIAALKQCGTGKLPLMNEITDFRKFLEKNNEAQKFICTMGAQEYIGRKIIPGKNAVVLIGPEGDFHQSEIDQAMEYGFIPVSLGHSRLRTETAALMTCAIFANVNTIQGNKI